MYLKKIVFSCALAFLLYLTASDSFAYSPPVSSKITITSQGPAAAPYFQYNIVDPITNEYVWGATPAIVAAPQFYSCQQTNSGLFYYSHYYPNDMASEKMAFGFAVYDPTKGVWSGVNYNLNGDPILVDFKDGVAIFTGTTYPRAGETSTTMFFIGTYDPDVGWVTYSFDAGVCYGGVSIGTSKGAVGWAYTNDSHLNSGVIGYAVYDPVRKQWRFGGDTTAHRGLLTVNNGNISYYPTSLGVLTTVGYKASTGAWYYNYNTDAIAAFRIGYSYKPSIPHTTVWLTDMSLAAGSVSINWGDNTSGSGSGAHAYSVLQQTTITESVVAASGGSAGSPFVYNNPIQVFAPVITSQPRDQSVITGSSATFTVAANGVPAPTFQWKKGGVDVAGAVGNSYTILSPTLIDAGPYVVVVTNTVGSVTSDAAILTVSAAPSAPVITVQPISQSVTEGSAVTFTVVVSGTPTPTFQWQKNGTSINGATNASYLITNATSSDAGIYSLVATNIVGSAISETVALTVVPTPPSVLVLSNVVGDFNGDGQADLLWQNTATGECSIWLMNGTSLALGVDLGTRSTNWQIAATADFNADGKNDIVWQNTSTGERSIWLMNGTTFNQEVSLPTLDPNWQIATAADFNGDGQNDLVWQNIATGERSIWLMNGAAFSQGVALPTLDPNWRIVTAADFNGDGQNDLVWQNIVTGERSIWLMNGTAFSQGVALPTLDPNWRIVTAADFNGDGQNDLVWQNIVTGERSIWLMNGATFSQGVALPTLDPNWKIRN